MMQDEEAALYNKVKDLYEQAKSIWKGVLFEILLDPINPESGERAERHIIDYRDCVEDFELNDGDPDKELTLDELFNEIGKLRDYKNILKAANESIENIKEQYGDRYTVTLTRVLDHSNQENLEIDIFESESEIESEEDIEPEEQEDDWDGGVWESDSGVESPVEYEQQRHLYSTEGSEIDNESDSGLQTESDAEAEWLLNWESGSESTRPATPEPNDDQNEELILNWESDTESNIAELSVSLEYETDEESKSQSSDHEVSNKSLDNKFDCDTSDNNLSSSTLDFDEQSTHKSPRVHQFKDEFIILGPNCTTLKKSEYEKISWKTARSAANALLSLVLEENGSAYSHLNHRTLADIYAAICSRFNISKHEAKSIIESECTNILQRIV